MIRVIDQPKDSPKLGFVAKDGMLFFNCTQETIDKAVEDANRRKAYLAIDEWGLEEGEP